MREYKIVVLGAGGVGKSSLTVQYVRGVYVETYDPTIEDSYRKSTAVDNRPCTLEILDTAGVEQFTAMRELYIKNGEGFILVYSVTNEESLAELALLRKQIIDVKENPNVPIVLVANKCDLSAERRISPQQGISTAESWGRVPFYETSAKYMSNVNEIFVDLVRQIMRRDSAFSPLSITHSQSSDEQGKNIDSRLGAGLPDFVKREANNGHLRASSLNVHHTLSTQKSRLLRSKQTRKGSLASSYTSDHKKDKDCIIM